MAELPISPERARNLDITGLSTTSLLVGTALICGVLWTLVLNAILV